MANGTNGDFSDGPLTPQEIKRVRQVLQSDDRARWFWSSTRTIALWITAVTVGLAAAKGFLVETLSGLLSGKH